MQSPAIGVSSQHMNQAGVITLTDTALNIAGTGACLPHGRPYDQCDRWNTHDHHWRH